MGEYLHTYNSTYYFPFKKFLVYFGLLIRIFHPSQNLFHQDIKVVLLIEETIGYQLVLVKDRYEWMIGNH